MREVAVGFIGVSLHIVVFTEREDDLTWIISLRRAEAPEKRKYESEI